MAWSRKAGVTGAYSRRRVCGAVVGQRALLVDRRPACDAEALAASRWWCLRVLSRAQRIRREGRVSAVTERRLNLLPVLVLVPPCGALVESRFRFRQ